MAVMLRTVKNGKGGESTLIVGSIPAKILSDGDDLFLNGHIVFVPNDMWKNPKYVGWEATDIITTSCGQWAINPNKE